MVRDGHSSGVMFAHCLEQPTRTASLTSPCGVIACANSPRCRPYSVLLPVWFAMPFPLPDTRCALTAPFHPCCPLPFGWGSGSFSVALSLGSPPPDVIRHRMSMEPGLSSPATFRRLPERPSGRLTLQGMEVQCRPVKGLRRSFNLVWQRVFSPIFGKSGCGNRGRLLLTIAKYRLLISIQSIIG